LDPLPQIHCHAAWRRLLRRYLGQWRWGARSFRQWSSRSATLSWLKRRDRGKCNRWSWSWRGLGRRQVVEVLLAEAQCLFQQRLLEVNLKLLEALWAVTRQAVLCAHVLSPVPLPLRGGVFSREAKLVKQAAGPSAPLVVFAVLCERCLRRVEARQEETLASNGGYQLTLQGLEPFAFRSLKHNGEPYEPQAVTLK